ncbi:MAG: TlpA family protein disulfide reductase [Bacteroidetes bacterium]|nr:TlpA family protein disulfide reductase [Bacteroidota bacterium]
MHIKENINKLVLFFCVMAFTSVSAQKPTVYKINDLLKRINNNSDTTYVVNFWATWCKPCVAELPEFEKLHVDSLAKNRKVKVLLVNMDFVEELDKKLKDFLVKNKYTCEIVLLDEINGNDFINKISEKWSGAIPATLITKKDKSRNYFHEGKITFEGLKAAILDK